MTRTTYHAPKLQPPGTGLPKPELLIARLLVGLMLRTTSYEKARATFADQMREILAITKGVDPALASQQVLIRRLRGMEDSSRYWSLYMTMEHLTIVNRFTIQVISSLRSGVSPDVKVSTAAVKPSPDTDRSAIERFVAVGEQFQQLYSGSTTLPTQPTLAHPWFGPLNARQWHFFAGFHMRLHKRQMIEIIKELQAPR